MSGCTYSTFHDRVKGLNSQRITAIIYLMLTRLFRVLLIGRADELLLAKASTIDVMLGCLLLAWGHSYVIWEQLLSLLQIGCWWAMIVDIRQLMQLMTWAIKGQVECLLKLLIEIFAISFFSCRILLNKVTTVIIIKISSAKGLWLTLSFLRKLIFCTLGELLLRVGSEKSLSVESHLVISKLWVYCSKIRSKVCPFHMIWLIWGRLTGIRPLILLIRKELGFLDPACIWAKYATHLSLLRIIIVLLKNWIQIRNLFLILVSFSNGY